MEKHLSTKPVDSLETTEVQSEKYSVQKVSQEREDNKENKSDPSKYHTWILIALATLPPCLYIVGLRYHQGMLEGAGINASHFPVSIHSIYVYAYEASIYFCSYFLQILKEILLFFWRHYIFSTSAIIIFVACMLVLIDKDEYLDSSKYPKFSIYLAALLDYQWKKNKLFKLMVLFTITISSFSLVHFMMFAIPFLWVMVPYEAYQVGSNESKKMINNYEDSGCLIGKNGGWNNCISLYDSKDKLIEMGLMITQNDRQIAIYNSENQMVKIVSLPEQYRIVRTYQKPSQAKSQAAGIDQPG